MSAGSTPYTTAILIREMKENIAKYGRQNNTTLLMLEATRELASIDAECDRLKALNAELSTACQSLIDYCDKNKPMGDSLWSVQQIRAALAKAKHKGETT